ncbi:hypothetical protein J2X65_004601 [Ancylobacter sp. 3268]|uniref:hypothetical protein n=1 Tax=Ancylobacter sp. 3268 TaxID=2817752 RepID=UPI0028586922|nr:hypothetical protein [Ancylobacter sp. 3268]MDR6955222.1 hypothetical protein [Ancylobacter sp. 3268]
MDRDEMSLGHAYMEEVFRIESKRWPGYLLLGGLGWVLVSCWRLWADGASMTYLMTLPIAAIALVAGAAVTINDHYERRYFLNRAVGRHRRGQT